MGKSTINRIIDEVCDAIWYSLTDFVKIPTTPQDWENINKDFDEIWNIPHSSGAIDGKHIAKTQPKHSGSLWHNYKVFFSLVLLAICGAWYCFSFVDVDEYRSNNDSVMFLNSQMGDLFPQDNLNIPTRSEISGSDYMSCHTFLLETKCFPCKIG